MNSSYCFNNSFYILKAKGPLSDFAVTPDIFEKAVREHDFSEKRNIHLQLCWGEYLEDTQFPIVFHPIRYSGKNFKDVLSLRYGTFVFLISDRFKSLLEGNGITGWKSYPIEVYDKKGNPILGYSGFSITGRGGEMEGARSPKWKEICDSRQRPRYHPKQWDGSDIFRIDPAYLVISKKLRDILIESKITGVEYFPLSKDIDIIE